MNLVGEVPRLRGHSGRSRSRPRDGRTLPLPVGSQISLPQPEIFLAPSGLLQASSNHHSFSFSVTSSRWPNHRGTNSVDGVALLSSVLRRFASMRLPPRVLACTHFCREVMDERCLPRCTHAITTCPSPPLSVLPSLLSLFAVHPYPLRCIPGSKSMYSTTEPLPY